LKQPEVKVIPLAKVLVAVPVWFKARTFSPPAKVEVAVEVALKVEAEMNPPATMFLPTSNKPEKVEVAVVDVAVKLLPNISPATESIV
jgi:hypothetical protein